MAWEVVNRTDSSCARSGIISKTQALGWRRKEETRVAAGFKAWTSGENLLPSIEKRGAGRKLGEGCIPGKVLSCKQ